MKMSNEFMRLKADQNSDHNNMFNQPYGMNPYGQPVQPYGMPPYGQPVQQPYGMNPYAQPVQQQAQQLPHPQVQPIIINTVPEQPKKENVKVIDVHPHQQSSNTAAPVPNCPPDSVMTTTTTTRVDRTKPLPHTQTDENDFYDIDGFYDNYDGNK